MQYYFRGFMSDNVHGLGFKMTDFFDDLEKKGRAVTIIQVVYSTLIASDQYPPDLQHNALVTYTLNESVNQKTTG